MALNQRYPNERDEQDHAFHGFITSRHLAASSAGLVCLWGMTSQADELEDLQTALETSNLPIESIC